MKSLIVLVTLLIAIHTTKATIDVKKLKETATPLLQTITDTASTQLKALHDTASTKLQTLTDTASTKLHTLTDTASTKLHTLTDTASTTLQQLTENASNNIHDFVETFTLENLKNLDFLNIIPRVHDRLVHKHFPSPKDKLKFYLKHVKGLKDKDVLLALHGEYPWPVVRRRIEYIYE